MINAADIFLLLFIAFVYWDFDVYQLIDLLNWKYVELYMMLGPMFAQIIQSLLLMVGNWLYKYYFGEKVEKIIYTDIVVAFTVSQVAGNLLNFSGGTVFLAISLPFTMITTYGLPFLLLSIHAWSGIYLVLFALLGITILGVIYGFEIS